jgi:hypothetical protein
MVISAQVIIETPEYIVHHGGYCRRLDYGYAGPVLATSLFQLYDIVALEGGLHPYLQCLRREFRHRLYHRRGAGHGG